MKTSMIFCLCILFSAGVYAQKNSVAVEEVVAAENAFADFAVAKGTRAVFLEFAADEGLNYEGTFKNAKESWKKRSGNSPVLIDWRPAWADAAVSGDIGYTTGPWSLHPKGATSEPVRWGEYWKKQPDGGWKWVIDVGITHQKRLKPIINRRYFLSIGEPSKNNRIYVRLYLRAQTPPCFDFIV